MMFAVEALALGLWIGALAGFAFLFAPAAFHTIPDLDVFAALVGTTLRSLNVFGLACGAIAIAAIALQTTARRPRVARQIAIVVMMGLSWYVTTSIVPRMEATAASFHAPFAAVAKSDPRRVEYDRLHETSSRLYGGVLIIGAIALAASASSRRGKR